MKLKGNEELIMRKEILVCDWDGVIQFIDRNWCMGIKEFFEYFKEYFDEEKLEKLGTAEFINEIINREDYYLNEYLLKNKNNPLPDHLFDLFMQLYTKPVNFYKGCNFTEFYYNLLNLVQQNTVKEIIFLTHVPFQNGIDIRKEEMFNNCFKPFSDKFKLIQIHNSYPKWKYLVDNDIQYTIFVDDRADIIKDVAMNTDCTEKQYWMPQFGYNKYLIEDQEFLSYLELNNAELYTIPLRLVPVRKLEEVEGDIA